MLDVVVLVMKVLPKTLISYLIGVLVRIRFPKPFQIMLNRVFVSVFKIDMSEAEESLSEYRSLEELFTRKIKIHRRAIHQPLCSPCDGMLTIHGSVHDQMALQVKGITYNIYDLMFGKGSKARQVNLTWFSTLYLAPHNYHRVHVPVSGKLRTICYFPGTLWPVNKVFVQLISGLFIQNERLVFEFELDNSGKVYVCMIGALNVGRMVASPLPDFVTNNIGSFQKSRQFKFDPPHTMMIGEELGIFMLGSTVVIAYDEAAAHSFQLMKSIENRPILMGEPLIF